MKQFKPLIIISLFVLMILVLSACGGKKSESTADEATPAETTVVLETTGDGGTIEKDSEGNIITKDDKGNVISVEDKDGKPIAVEQYITTHSWVVSNDSAGSSGSSGKSSDSSGSGSSGKSGNSGSSDGSGGSPSSGSGSGSASVSSSSDREEIVEESIPVVVATIPDEEDMAVLPDL